MDKKTAFELPDGSEIYLALQRTAYQHPINKLFRRLHLGRFYDRWMLGNVEKRRAETLKSRYYADLRSDYEAIRDHLPSAAPNILDIGSGLGGIDVFLYRHYSPRPVITLLDKEGISAITYGFKDIAAHYNSLELSRRFLEGNGIASSNLRTFDIDRDGFPSDLRYDLVISLISWGFHYPIDTYIEQVKSAVAPGGALVIDVRRNTTGMQRIEQCFGQPPVVITESEKHQRVIVRVAPEIAPS